MITQLKSVVLSLAMIDRHLTVEQAVLLSRLEEEYQVGMPHTEPDPTLSALLKVSFTGYEEKTGSFFEIQSLTIVEYLFYM